MKSINHKNKLIPCLCDNPTCRKCLTVNCRNDNCKTHSLYKKIVAKREVLENVKKHRASIKKAFIESANAGSCFELQIIKQDIKKLSKEIKRLESLYKAKLPK